MVIDSHMHLARKENFDAQRFEKFGLGVPENTDIDQLVGWLKSAGVLKAVAMGQDMSRIWNTSFGEEYVLESFRKYPDFFIPFASVEPLDQYNCFKNEAYDYFIKAVTEYGFKGLLLTPPYGQYMSNDKTIFPFYKFAQENDIVVQYHHSAQIGPVVLAPMKYANMLNLSDVIMNFPDMKVVVEHLGYPRSEELFVLMANSKNLYTDLAMEYSRPMWMTWNLVIAKEYGVIDRIMYASDFVAAGFDAISTNPKNDFETWINFVRYEINNICKKSGWPQFSQEEIEGILWRNAAGLYDIKTD